MGNAQKKQAEVIEGTEGYNVIQVPSKTNRQPTNKDTADALKAIREKAKKEKAALKAKQEAEARELRAQFMAEEAKLMGPAELFAAECQRQTWRLNVISKNRQGLTHEKVASAYLAKMDEFRAFVESYGETGTPDLNLIGETTEEEEAEGEETES